MTDEPKPTITEQERKTLDEHQFALATADEAVKNGVANSTPASPSCKRSQRRSRPASADYEAGSPASVNPRVLIADLEAIASMKALNVTLIGSAEDLPPPARD